MAGDVPQYSFGSEGTGAGQFTGGGRAIDIDGAATSGWPTSAASRPRSTSRQGRHAARSAAPTPAAKPPVGLLGQPRDVAVDDETGEVWVADAWNQRFSRFSATGVSHGPWGHRGPGGAFDMNYPRSDRRSTRRTATRIWVAQRARPPHPGLQLPDQPARAAPTYVAQVGPDRQRRHRAEPLPLAGGHRVLHAGRRHRGRRDRRPHGRQREDLQRGDVPGDPQPDGPDTSRREPR